MYLQIFPQIAIWGGLTFSNTSRWGRPMAADLTNFEIKNNNCVILLLVWSHKMTAGWCPFSAFYDFFIFQIILNVPRERRAGARSKLPDNEGYRFWSIYRTISISKIESDKRISKQLKHRLFT